MKTSKTEKLQAVLNAAVDNKKIFGTTFAIKHNDDIWQGAAGNVSIQQPYFIASTTKLFTTAMVLKLQSEEKLSIQDRIDKYVDNSIVQNLAVFKGRDFFKEITIEHLLSHTSGIPDYFQGKGNNGKSLEDDLTSGLDQGWTFLEAIERSKTMKSTVPPNSKGKAVYSDTNFQLLGNIIESITQKPYASLCQEMIIKPLALDNTYLYEDEKDDTPLSLYYKNETLAIPKAMTSFGPDGGIVSTNQDMLIFIEAFFTGKLFPKEYLAGLYKWNKIFFPMQAGVGIHRFKLPWFFDPFNSIPEFIGHSGLSGALAFHAPKENLFIVGTVNQIAHPSKSFNLMVKLVQKVLKE